MGCHPSKGYTSMNVQPDTKEDIEGVHQLISKLENPSLDAIKLKNLISSLPKLFPSILRYLKHNKKTMSKNPELLTFIIKDYLGEENTIAVLNFLSEFNPSIDIAGDRLANIKSVLQCVVDYEDECLDDNDKVKTQKFRKAKKKLEKYMKIKVAREVCSECDLNSLHQKQKSIERELKQRRDKLEHQKKSIKMWRMLYNVAYKSLFVAVLGCAVAVAAIHAPPAAITAATAGATILGAMQAPLDSLWTKSMKVLEAEKQAMMKMERGDGLIKAHELENSRVAMNNMKVEMDKIAGELEFIVKGATKNEDGIEVDTQEMEKKVEELEVNISKVKKMVGTYVNEMGELACELLKFIVDEENPT